MVVVVDPVYPRQLLRPPQFPSQLAFAREQERGADGGVGGGGGDRRRSCWLLVSRGDGSGSKTFLSPKTALWELLFGTVATRPATHGAERTFLPGLLLKISFQGRTRHPPRIRSPTVINFSLEVAICTPK